jgi:hypothetical protein
MAGSSADHVNAFDLDGNYFISHHLPHYVCCILS